MIVQKVAVQINAYTRQI